MNYTIKRLMDGEGEVASWYAAAAERWDEMLSAQRVQSLQSLAMRISNEQLWFEENCGTRYVGQEVMGWVAIAQFYRGEDGFGPRQGDAEFVLQAIRQSGCSVEVCGHAEAAARHFRLIK